MRLLLIKIHLENVEAIVPEDFRGTVPCDGYAVYRCFAERRDGAVSPS